MTPKLSTRTLSKIMMSGAAIASVAMGGAAAQTDTIVVTATKRPQTLQEVPVAVSVVDADAIEKANVQDLADLQTLVPSLRISTLQNSSQTNFIIRGFGNGANNPGIESSVGVFIDGVYRSRSAAAILDLPILERVEVLRGPQSTLFGKNVSAGAISITTKRPEFDLGGGVELTAGNLGQVVFRGSLTGPITDTLAVRVSGTINNQDAYYDNSVGPDVNERDRWAVRADALWEPTDTLSFRLIGDYNKIDETCCGAIQLLNGPATQAIGAPAPFGLGLAIDPADGLQYEVALNERVFNELEGKGLSLQGDLDLGFAQLTSITAYREQTDISDTDADFSAAAVARNPQNRLYETFTQEVRIASTGDNFIDWLVGGFYFDEKLEFERDVIFGDDARGFFDIISSNAALGGSGVSFVENAAGFLPGTFFTSGTGFFGDYEMDNRSYSLFGQVDVNLTDRLTLTGGISYINDRKEYVSNELLTEGFSIGGAGLLTAVGAGVLEQQALATTLATDFMVDVSNPANIAAFAAMNPAIFAQVQAGAQAFAAANASNPDVNPLFALSDLQLFEVPVNVPDPSNPLDDGFVEDDSVNYTARVAYDVTDWLNAYFTYSTGFKAAAVNLSSDSRPPDPATGLGREARPEDVELFEIGFKTSFPGGYLNIALFDQTIQEFQSNTFVGTAFVLANASDQSVKGFEIDGAWSPVDALSFNFGLTYLDPNFDSFPVAPCSTFEGTVIAECVAGADTFDASGLRPAGIAPVSFSISGIYTRPIKDNLDGYLRGEYYFESETQVIENVPASIASRDLSQLNISGGFVWDNGFELSGFVRNALDDRYLQSAFPTVAQPGSFSGYLNEPRTYGVTVRKNF